jgi:hypothetical protein
MSTSCAGFGWVYRADRIFRCEWCGQPFAVVGPVGADDAMRDHIEPKP